MALLKIQYSPTEKQGIAWDFLQDNSTKEILFGGGAGGGKSYLACAWLISSCLRYPGSRWFMARDVLKTLKASTLLTFFEVCKQWSLRTDEHFFYNQVDGTIKFYNDSVIFLKELAANPSDPEFERLGSTEYTGGIIDEGSEITKKAYDLINSRIRFKLEEFKLIPKILICTNPCKTFLYYDFYKPWIDKKLPQDKKFVQALVDDNSYISPQYKLQLEKLDEVSRQRLLLGNWEYSDDPTRLIDYGAITDIFSNTISIPKDSPENKYLSGDIARYGGDQIVFMKWLGFRIQKIWAFNKLGIDETAQKLIDILANEQIPRSHTIIDDDGVGGGVVDIVKGVKGFVNNSSPIAQPNSRVNEPQFRNLKTQCYFMLADKINKREISCYNIENSNWKERLIQDLEQIKRKNDDDKKLEILPKKEMKESLGRSPDFGDAMMMRMFFELKPASSKVLFASQAQSRMMGFGSKQDAQVYEHLMGNR